MTRSFSCDALIFNSKYKFRLKTRGFNELLSRIDFILVLLNASDDLKRFLLWINIFQVNIFNIVRVWKFLLFLEKIKMVFLPHTITILLIRLLPWLPLPLFLLLRVCDLLRMNFVFIFAIIFYTMRRNTVSYAAHGIYLLLIKEKEWKRRQRLNTYLQHFYGFFFSQNIVFCRFASNASNERISNCFEQNKQKATFVRRDWWHKQTEKESHETIFIILIYNILHSSIFNVCIHYHSLSPSLTVMVPV